METSSLFLAHSPPPKPAPLMAAPAPASQQSSGEAEVWGASLQGKGYRELWPLGPTVGRERAVSISGALDLAPDTQSCVGPCKPFPAHSEGPREL